MKTIHSLRRLSAVLLGLLAALALIQPGPARADITVRLSVKFILDPNGNYPSGGIGVNAGFETEVTRGNGVLNRTGRGYKLQVIEYIAIMPPAPAGQPANYWFTNSARTSRQEVETASINDPVTWRRNGNGAINIYVNDSSSGQCSFLNNGDSITLGKTVAPGTLLHEIGHFFNLSHTHANDPNCTSFTPPMPLSAALGNGDGLSETLDDHPCYDRDQLSIAHFNTPYTNLTAAQQTAIDGTFLNVMSYHQEDLLLDIQMDYWTAVANIQRNGACSGRTWFIATTGIDPILDPFILTGLEPGHPMRTLDFALNSPALDPLRSPDDVLLLRAGTYSAPELINTPCTLRATAGPVNLQR